MQRIIRFVVVSVATWAVTQIADRFFVDEGKKQNRK